MAHRALLLAAGVLAAGASPPSPPSSPSSPRPNLLYIVIDDLRPELSGFYNHSSMITPAFDRLQAAGTTFTRAYANVAVCSPSRTSFLTGTRPATNRVWTIGPYFRQQAHNASGIVTLSEAFKTAGWNATGAGKVWHPGSSSGGSLSPNVGGDDMPMSWSYEGPAGGPAPDAFNSYFECDQFYNASFQSPRSVFWPGGAGCIQSDACIACLTAHGSFGGNLSRSWTSTPCPDDCFPDGAVADRGIAELEWKAAAAAPATPFTLFLGFKRPHLSFFGPDWAYDLYDNASTSLSPNRLPPTGMPQDAFFQNGEIAGNADVRPFMYTYNDGDGGRFSLVEDAKQHELRWAYRSVVSFMDAQVGRVLDALEATGLRETTWIVAHGDHGWSLGERGEWAKQNLFEEGTRVPLIVVPPSGPLGAGFATNATFDGLVELVDLFPTLADVLGLPGGIVPDGQLQGDSLAAVLRGQAAAGGGNFSTAFSEIARGDNVSPTEPPPDGSIHGLSVRTPDWRFSAWVPFNYSGSRPLWSAWNSTHDVELYDMRSGSEDYDVIELVNLARDPAYADVVAQLTETVQAAWPA
jgi:iduronate 2-sulfatase